MLTVWRKLHLEFDSMDAPPTSGPETPYLSGVATRVTPNWLAVGKSFVTVLWTNTAGVIESFDEYERGKLDVTGVNMFRGLNSSSKVVPGGRTFVEMEIDGVLSATNQGRRVKLYIVSSNVLLQRPKSATSTRL